MRWIRVVIVAVLLIVSSTGLRAQTFSEWFRQKATQKRYLLEQLAALRVYAGYVHKGYGIVSDGLQTVRDITGGEFSLHELFITGLKKVSRAIRNDVRIVEILRLQGDMVWLFKGLSGKGDISPALLDYVLSVRLEVVSEGLSDLEELLLVVTSGRAEMTDDQRLARLDDLYGRSLERSAFVRDFCGSTEIMLQRKAIERNEIDRLRRWYENR
ncbi:hypothetical protein ACQKCH_11150 [Nubsella zeaxanthinifaciens]|uniref:hypothetical protein n=1 Tax=Nubsella zeaxanthinifaciens TaxID=392412 RepID=UPI003D059DD4